MARDDTSPEIVASLLHARDDAAEVTRDLAHGLDVNVGFHDIRAFEYTPALGLFDACDVELVHAWLAAGEDHAWAPFVEPLKYNELIDRVVVWKSNTDAPSRSPEGGDDPNSPPQEPIVAATGPADDDEEEEEAVRVALFEAFLDDTPTQMTEAGEERRGKKGAG